MKIAYYYAECVKKIRKGLDKESLFHYDIQSNRGVA